MRFLLDMGLSPKTGTFLREIGHDATHLVDEGLQRMDDSDILAKARDEHRVLLTHDLDFADLMAAGGDRLPSVIVFRLHRMRPEVVNQYICKVISEHAEVLEQGVIISVTEGRARVRPLPLQLDEA